MLHSLSSLTAKGLPTAVLTAKGLPTAVLTAKGLPTAALFCALFLFACQNPLPDELTDVIALPENSSLARYDKSELQKMRWLAGIWEGEKVGRVVRQSFQFHSDNTLEVIRTEGNGEMTSLLFTWQNGRYHYGQNRQWAVTWIGKKEVRFDPLTSDGDPMTWTRLDDNRWHLVRHTPNGDETTVMERTDEMQP
jgi:hypothetical protein